VSASRNPRKDTGVSDELTAIEIHESVSRARRIVARRHVVT
jgi:hypothetical protein